MKGWWALPALLLLSSGLRAELTAHEVIAGISTLRDTPVAFSERRMSPLLAAPLELRGEVEFSSDGTLSKRIDEPFSELISISEREVMLERDGRRRRVSMRRDTELWRFYRSLRAMLAGESETLLEIYEAKLSDNSADWVLELQPRTVSPTGALVSMTVLGSGGLIREVQTRQAENNWQVISFHHVEGQ